MSVHPTDVVTLSGVVAEYAQLVTALATNVVIETIVRATDRQSPSLV